MARNLFDDVRQMHPDLVADGEEVTGVFLGIPSDSKWAILDVGLERAAADHRKASKDDRRQAGISATIPKKVRFVMVTSDRVAFFAGRTAAGGGAPTEVLADIPASSVAEISFQRKGDRTTIDFTDGSAITLKTRATKQLREFGQKYLGVDKPFKTQR